MQPSGPPSIAPAAERHATETELVAWVEAVTGAKVAGRKLIAGGNRCQSWTMDLQRAGDDGPSHVYLRYQPPRPPSAEPYTVLREAEIYGALGGGVPAARLIAVNTDLPALLTEGLPGRADFRRLTDPGQRETIARQFIAALASLHKLPIEGRSLPGLTAGADMAAAVREELRIWRAMYEETATRDPLIDVALGWLDAHVPETGMPPVFVHGDAGPGNFMFDRGELTGLIDWELAHAGDPMEDLAWFSMRAVMEPVPDFPALLREYGRIAGEPPDAPRILYHRVFVSTRVVIIRHRNVTGQPGNSLVSKALNRRLLVTALAAAMGAALPPAETLKGPETPRTEFYEHVLADLKQVVDSETDAQNASALKLSARVIKYLRDCDRYGGLIEARELDALQALLGVRPPNVTEGRAAIPPAIAAGRLSLAEALAFFSGSVEREALLAAGASGGLARRGFPPLDLGGA